MERHVGHSPYRSEASIPREGPVSPAVDREMRQVVRLHFLDRLIYAVQQQGLTYLLYRYRYLACFTLIGLLSILLELALTSLVLPQQWTLSVRSLLAFGVGIIFSFVMNAFFNFQVTWRLMVRAFGWFCLISLLSYGLNMAVVMSLHGLWGEHYAWLRLGTAGGLFALGYSLHRRFTFGQARNFGLVVYASEADDPQHVYEVLGRNCDHVHVDLIDETMTPQPAPIRLSHLAEVRRLWPDRPVALHVMSHVPRRWMEQTWDLVDWYLLHLQSEDDLMELIFECRMRRKKVGVVWQLGTPFAELLAYLPHVDFVMVLGIRQPGRSGQSVDPHAIEVDSTLNRLRGRYGYELMFDGGVTVANIARIEAKYIVAASAVLSAPRPIRAAHVLRSGARYEVPEDGACASSDQRSGDKSCESRRVA